MKRFVFDLDGTITKEETLPKIAQHFNVQAEIDKLTQETIVGNIPFIESFIRRVNILGKLPVDEIANLLEQVEIYENLNSFIGEYGSQCVIATQNLHCWIHKLVAKVGGVKKQEILTFSSNGVLRDNKIFKLTSILKKEMVVKQFQAQGDEVIFIGDGNNDVEAMRIANVSIASGLTHKPCAGVLSVTDYAVFSEEALCRLVYQLL